jgi:hypothetical protein
LLVREEAPQVKCPDRPNGALPSPLVAESARTGIFIAFQRRRETGGADGLGNPQEVLVHVVFTHTIVPSCGPSPFPRNYTEAGTVSLNRAAIPEAIYELSHERADVFLSNVLSGVCRKDSH